MDEVKFSSNKISDYVLFTKSLNELPKLPKTLISTINQYSFCLAGRDSEFQLALKGSDVLLPDGIGMVAALRILYGQKIRKIAGDDLHNHFLKTIDKVGGSCFYLGSSEKTLKKIEERLKLEFPNIKTGFYSPPYAIQFSTSENNLMINTINAFKPDVLFIGLTAPKQEKWAFVHKKNLDVKIICSIGAVFDFYAGTINRPGQFWIILGLEWFIRLLKEPRRMWKRYLYFGPIFIINLIKEKNL